MKTLNFNDVFDEVYCMLALREYFKLWAGFMKNPNIYDNDEMWMHDLKKVVRIRNMIRRIRK